MLCMNRSFFSVCSAFILFASFVHAVPPVLNYAGQVKVDGQAFNGTGHLKFALVSPSGDTTYWSQDGSSVDGGEPSGSVSVQVRGGLYSILLGNTAIDGMGAIEPSLFSTHSDLHLRVWFNDGVNGFERIVPDRPFASVPYALSAGSSNIQSGSITTNQLNEQILKYLRPEITQNPVLAKDREQVYSGQTITLSSDAEGKFLSYQWLKDGEPVAGATNREFTITDANGSLHNGNYTVQVSNDFGSVSSEAVQIDVNDTQLIHQIDLNSTVSLEMIWVGPGTFTMGSPESETGRNTNETQHEVTLTNGFYLGKYEVTQSQYEAVMTGNSDNLSATPSQYSGNPDGPVEQVSWDDIQKFLILLNAQEAGNIREGWAYVLPTEAQWEYACRAGTTTAYSWGDSITTSDANYYESGYSQTRDVSLYNANPWGFFDMHGNVREWTADWYAVYGSGVKTDPEGPATGSGRVNRGGSWKNDLSLLRSAHRSSFSPSHRDYRIGFRVGFQQIPADVVNPEMQIFGDANVTHLQDNAWVDPGVEAHDIRDGNLTSSVNVSGTVDVNTTGTYTLTYTVSDAAGNEASITRTVNVGIPANYATDLNSTVSLEMIWVEPGTFTMGSPETETGRQESETQHEVTLTTGFYLGKYEVTQAQYEAVMTGNTETDNNGNVISATPSYFGGNPNRPVEQVSWEDIQVFLTRLNDQEAGNIPAGWAYVLPTEAQWEYACRAGTTTAYSWGDSITTDNASYSSSGYLQTRDVGIYDANPWGFFDMHGNVWEWTSDWYAAYSSSSVTDPEGPATGSGRIVRGGSYNSGGRLLRSANREEPGSSPSRRGKIIGFRVGFQQIPADVASPEMQIFGDANITHLKDTAWVDPGVEAHDVRDGNITDSITVSGTVDVNTTGTYTLTYTVSDAAGNEASLTRTVNVVADSNWDKTYGGSANDYAYSALLTNDDGYLLVGKSESGAGGDKTQSGQGWSDIWVVKIDADGNKSWDKSYGGSSHDYANAALSTNDGGYLLVGVSESGADGDKTQSSQGGNDIWVVKIDADGNKVWDKAYGGGGSEYANAALSTNDGGYLLVGNSGSGADGDKTQSGQGWFDIWVVKIDADGNKVWDKSYGGSGQDYAKATLLTNDDGFLLIGHSRSGADGDKTQSSQGGNDIWVVKIDADGNKVWDKSYGGSGHDYANAALSTNDGGYLLVGHSESGADGDKTQSSQGGNDIWVVKIDADGNKVWDKAYGGSGNDIAYSALSTIDDGFLLVGESNSGTGGDKTQSSQGEEDYWAVKIDADGNKVWDKTYGGNWSDKAPIALSTNDDVFLLVGSSGSGASGDKTESSRGIMDYWAVKIDANGNN
jgi:formylglycine-generating enzyme required for sulfatase activity